MINIFIDTSAFYARLDHNDKNHGAAIRFFDTIKTNGLYVPVITNYIFNETITLVRYKLGIAQSIEFGKSLLESKAFTTIFVTKDSEEKAWEIFSKYTDKDFSFTDCTSFAIMQEHGITNAFTFDKHFAQFGFEILPK